MQLVEVVRPYGKQCERRDDAEERNAATVDPSLAADSDGPVRLSWINSASQDMPRSGVLDPQLDPTPGAPYRMSHPSFVLEWADGRVLLVDLGMSQDEARNFGAGAELIGARPIEPHTPTAAQLGARADDVEGVLFSHLHHDHVDGITALCEGRSRPLRVFGTKAQLTRPNYLTTRGLDILNEAGCVELVPLEEGNPLEPVPGFPGVRVIAAAGHTPGSQIVVARVGDGESAKSYAFTGDIVNIRDGVRHDLPKPWIYSTLVVPEDTDRLGEVRRFLRRLHQDEDVTLLVQHDELSIQETGVPRWAGAP